MDIKIIKSVIGLFENSKLTELEIDDCTESGIKIKMSKNDGAAVISAPVLASNLPIGKPNQEIPYTEGVVDFNHLSDVKSPMVGMFFTSNSPESEAFVRKGDHVKKGDTLCIIEAMKLMNEVVALADGEIVDIVAKNGELVEFGQVLFRIL